jgi:hypothetical protein
MAEVGGLESFPKEVPDMTVIYIYIYIYIYIWDAVSDDDDDNHVHGLFERAHPRRMRMR